MTMKQPSTYRASDVTVILGGSHIVSGYAEDSHISIVPDGGTITMRTGADGEIVRDMDESKRFKITLNLLYGSETANWLNERFKLDRQTGNAMFDTTVKDLSGVNPTFNGRYCCLENPPTVNYTKTAPTLTYVILVAYGEYA